MEELTDFQNSVFFFWGNIEKSIKFFVIKYAGEWSLAWYFKVSFVFLVMPYLYKFLIGVRTLWK
jgi:hypothetical protein